MRLVTKTLVGFLFLFFCASQPGVEAQSKATLYEGARLITGDGTAPIEDSAFLVENGKFAAVGKKGEVKLPKGGARVDLTGKTVIPGIIDAHVHMGWARLDNWTNGLMNYTGENLIDNLHRAAYMGVVAVWSAGTDVAPLCFEIRDAVNAGKYQDVARWIPSGPGFTTMDTANPQTQRMGGYLGPKLGIAVTPEQAKLDVDVLYANKVPIVKAWVNSGGGNMFASKEPMDPAIPKAFIDEAHKHNMKVFIHAHIPEEAELLIQDGVDGFAHMIDDIGTPPAYLQAHNRPAGPTPELLEMLKQHTKIFMTFTQPDCPGCEAARFKGPDPLLVDTVPPEALQMMRDKALKPPTPEQQERQQKNWAARTKWTQEFIETGIRIGLGSDSDHLGSQMIGWATHKEMEEMVATGMKPADVIVAATKTNAEWLGLDDLGMVAPRKTATFVVLDANPLDDITNTRRINAVYLNGKEVDRTGLKAGFLKSFSNYVPGTASRSGSE